jgi:hypothetical protein
MVNHHLKHKSNIAFVLGNGRSRLEIDHTKLSALGTVYGCNAIYREFDPDHLVAVDVKMVNEIIASGYHNEHSVWTNPNKGVAVKTGIQFFNPHKGWSSGPTALWLAASTHHKTVYILGFDYQGLNGKFNNVYADTFNYKKSSDAATFHGNWLAQTEKVIKEYKNAQFIRVIESGAYIPDSLNKISNLRHQTINEFRNMLEGDI